MTKHFGEVDLFCASDCPVACDLADKEKAFRLEKDDLTNFAQRMFMVDEGEGFESRFVIGDPNDVDAPTANHFRDGLRTSTVEQIDSLDVEIDKLTERRRALGETCSQAFETRVSTGEQEFTVGICTSPLAYEGDGHNHVPVHIELEGQPEGDT